jgi:hypothetical protein
MLTATSRDIVAGEGKKLFGGGEQGDDYSPWHRLCMMEVFHKRLVA